MANPYIDELTIHGDFLHLDYLRGLFPDTHFKTRDRMGRMLAIMGKEGKEGKERGGRGGEMGTNNKEYAILRQKTL